MAGPAKRFLEQVHEALKSHTGFSLAAINPNGLTEITTAGPQNARKVLVDIVFVHGFGGHPLNSWLYMNPEDEDPGGCYNFFCCMACRPWRRAINDLKKTTTDRERYWPWALANKKENAERFRIFTYGYSSGLSSRSTTNLTQHATDLLTRLSDMRNRPGSDPQRPIIFICHSLGGLLVKDALFKSHMEWPGLSEPESGGGTESNKHHISASCKAVFFFGTPHQGSDFAKTGKRIIKALAPHGDTELFRSLLPNSETRNKINDEFNQYIDSVRNRGEIVGGFRVCSLVEGVPMWPCGEVVSSEPWMSAYIPISCSLSFPQTLLSSSYK